jgi:ankyrin repeat protein
MFAGGVLILQHLYRLFATTQNDTALSCASYEGHVDVVKLLLALPGIDYNHTNNEVWCEYIPLRLPQKVHT